VVAAKIRKTLVSTGSRKPIGADEGRPIDELQADLDEWMKSCNEERPHQGRWCYGKTPMQTFLDTIRLRRRNCCPPHDAAQIFVGHSPRRRPSVRSSAYFYSLIHGKSVVGDLFEPRVAGLPQALELGSYVVIKPAHHDAAAIKARLYPLPSRTSSNRPQPILTSKPFDAGKLPLIIGHHCVAERGGLRRDQQVIAADRSPIPFEPST
jgi:hypothetical protein